MTDEAHKRPGGSARLPKAAHDAIGRALRESLERIVAEPIPDRFLRLLDELETADRSAADAAGRGDDPALETSGR